MGIPGESCAQLVVKFAVVFPHLDERQRRLLMGAEARILGYGGVRVVARAAGTSETTVRKGVDELEAGGGPPGRGRPRGGGGSRGRRGRARPRFVRVWTSWRRARRRWAGSAVAVAGGRRPWMWTRDC